jgi:hypothetical protein
MRLRSNRGRRAGIALRLERLDDRALPSVTFVETNGTLYVRGDQQANTIVIADDGSTNAGNIVVQADGQTYTSQTAITKIQVNARNGDDSVEYDLNFELMGERTVKAYLGNGDDSFVAKVHANINDPAALTIRAWGNNGEDQLSFDGIGANVGLGSSLKVCFDGGNGKDNLNFDYSGALNGIATFNAQGGNGKDVVAGHLNVEPSENPETHEDVPSTGSLTAHFHGGNGVDDMTLQVTGTDSLTSLDATLRGGHGKDTFDTSANVKVIDSDCKKH